MHRTVNALVLVLLVAGLGLAPPAQAATDGRRLLIGVNSLVDGAGALRSQLPILVEKGARFSPDGTLLAYDAGGGRVGIQHADGSNELLPAIEDVDVRSIAWDPDGSRLAVLGYSFEPGNNEARVYLVPLDGSPAIRVFDDTLTVRLNSFAGISWRSSDDTLAVIATEFFENDAGGYSAFVVDTDLVWTMPAMADATPTRWSGRSEECPDFCQTMTGYRWPTWSPDGTRLAVLDADEETVTGYVGYLSPGASAATRLADASTDRPVAWSEDGEELAFAIPDVDGDDATQGYYPDTRVVDADTGATLTTISDQPEQLLDRLPCPGGECPVWEDVYVAPVPSMNIRGRAKAAKVVASGSMRSVPITTTLDITLFKKARAASRWKMVVTAEVDAIEGMFKKSFPRPRAVQCKVKGVYEATDGQRATDSDTFRC